MRYPYGQDRLAQLHLSRAVRELGLGNVDQHAREIDGRPLVVEIQLTPILGQIGDLLGEQLQQSVLDCDLCIFNHFKDV